MPEAPSVLNIHTPTSSFAIIHSRWLLKHLHAVQTADDSISVTQESLLDLYNKLSRKASTDYYGQRVGPGWLKYEYNDAIWTLDDGQPPYLLGVYPRDLTVIF